MLPPLLAFLAPVLLAFEVCQLVVAERYLGLKQIEHNVDPRSQPMSEWLACAWTLAIVVNWTWMLTMMATRFAQGQVAAMLAVSLFGYSLRRNCRLKRVLMVLTFEGAIRIGMLVSVFTQAWAAT